MEELAEFVVINSSSQPLNDVTSAQNETVWTRSTTLSLIDFYKKYRTKVGTFAVKNLKRLWAIIAEEINKMCNTSYTPAQVENRWRVLERNYKKVVDNNNQTGRGRKYFEFTKEMDEVFGKKRNIHPEILLDTNSIAPMANQSEEQVDDCDVNVEVGDFHSIPPQNKIETKSSTPSTLHAKTVTCTPKPKSRNAYRNSALQKLQSGKLSFYQDYIKNQNEKLEVAKQKLVIKNEKLEEKKRKNNLMEERNHILKSYLQHKIEVPHL